MMFDWETFLPRYLHDARAVLRKAATKAQMLDRRWDEQSPELRTLLHETIDAQANLDKFFQRLGTLVEAYRPPATDKLPLRTIVGLARMKKKDRLSAAGADLRIGELCGASATTELQTVLEELLDNSTTFLCVERPLEIRIEAHTLRDLIRLTFHDNAAGWDPRLGDAVFVPLQRVDLRGGFGLGLAITRAVVTTAGGSIVATTSPAGSTFQIDLPLND
jgi:light-regulated signal transduction histidine kinase (bacteriophytochrome)